MPFFEAMWHILMCDLAFLVHMDLETLAQACADINVLLLLQLHKTTVAIQCVC